MKISKLTTFYENIDQYRPFERVRKLKKLTNNFDNALMNSLELDFFQYYINKMEKITIESNRYDVKKVKSFFDKAHNSKVIGQSLNRFADEYISHFDFDIISDIIDKTTNFSDELFSYNTKTKTITYDKFQNRKEYRMSKIKETEQKKEELEKDDLLFDYSDSTIIKKIIFLSKLGILDFLMKSEPFNTSVNSMATVLSSITGAKTVSIQPVLNPLITKEIENKNHPFKSEKTVKTVEQQLINLGYKLKDN